MSQSQFTSLPNNGTRVRTAQGFDIFTSSAYASYYQETRILDDVDADTDRVVIKTERKELFEFIETHRVVINVSVSQHAPGLDIFFLIGLDTP